MKLSDISLTEWAVTDMHWWNELAYAVTTWQRGKAAKHGATPAGPPIGMDEGS